jgi:cobalt-zinc-cadmium efflux system outer membrane protein
VSSLSKVATCFVAALLATGCQRFASVPLDPSKSAHEFAARSLGDPHFRRFVESVRGAQPVWPMNDWDFDQLTLAALYYQPGLNVWRTQWRSAQAAELTAAGRLNPVLTIVPGYSMNASAGLSPWLPLTSVDIPIETAGKRDLRKLHAAQLAAATQLNAESAAWQARSHLRTTLLDLSLNERRAELLERQVEFQKQTVEMLEQRLAAGAVSPFEVSVARTSRLRVETEAADARLRAKAARTQVAEAIGVSSAALEGIQLAAFKSATADEVRVLLSTEARDRALQRRSDIRALLAEYAASETALRVEIAKQYPDVHLNPGYQYDQGEHKWSLGLTVELPLLNQNQGPIAEAEAKRKETAARFLALQAQIIARIEQSVSELNALNEQRTRARNLLDLQRQQRNATEAAFRAGGADRLEMTAANLEAIVAELTAADFDAREIAALGKLEDALQQDAATTRAIGQSINLAGKSHD